MVRGESSCHGEGACVEQQQPCLLQVVKKNWKEIGISLKIDKDIIRMMKDVKGKFDKARGKMSAAKKDELVTSLKETTLNIAASNWKQKVNQDSSLNAAWRQEKIDFIEDYIGREATR